MDRKPCGEKLPVLCQKHSVNGNNMYSWTKYCTEGRRNIENWMEDKDGDCSDLCKFEMLQTTGCFRVRVHFDTPLNS